MTSAWDPTLDPQTNADHTPLPSYDDSFSADGLEDQQYSTLRRRYNQHLRDLWSRPRSVYRTMDGMQNPRQDMVSTPQPAQAFEEALAENLTRNRYEQTSVVGLCDYGWSDPDIDRTPVDHGWREQDIDTTPMDLWKPEPPLKPSPPEDNPWAFLELMPPGSGTLTYADEAGNLISIHNLNLGVIEVYAPIIAAAFEPSDRDERLHLDVLTQRTALPLCRFLYTGSYCDGQHYEDVPTSLLLHSELHFIASVFDIPDLKAEAWMNVKRQCEFACASPDKPLDLVPALRFCYAHIDTNQRCISDIIDYCIERFFAHKLKTDPDFALLTREKQFCSDLAKACRQRNFEDDSAVDIVRLQHIDDTPSEYASLDESSNRRVQDIAQHFRRSAGSTLDQPGETPAKPSAREQIRRPGLVSGLSLAIRGKAQANDEDISSSEDEGFKLVRPLSDSEASTPTESEFVLVMRSRREQQERERLAAASHANAAKSDGFITSDDDSDWTLA